MRRGHAGGSSDRGDVAGRSARLARCGHDRSPLTSTADEPAREMSMTDTQTELIEEMFVQVARGVTTTEGSMTLVGASPSTLYFSDRPERVVGHMTSQQFVEQWNQGADSFAADPPNAVLSFAEPRETHPQMSWSCCAIRRSGKTRSATRSRCSTARCRSRRARARCSSTRLGDLCPQCPPWVCTDGIAGGCAAAEPGGCRGRQGFALAKRLIDLAGPAFGRAIIEHGSRAWRPTRDLSCPRCHRARLLGTLPPRELTGSSRSPASSRSAKSKLRSPASRPGLVPRTTLVNRLLASEAPIVSVVGPAGYGKTTLLDQWLASTRLSSSWVTLDERDNDVGVLAGYLAAALHTIEPIELRALRALASTAHDRSGRRG